MVASTSEIIAESLRRQQEQQRVAAGNQAPIDADRAGRVNRVGAATGLPQDLIDAGSNLETLEEQLDAQTFDYDSFADSGVFRSFASENPYNLAVVKEDMEGMSTIGRSFARMGMAYTSGQADVDISKIQTRRMLGNEQEGDEELLADLEKFRVEHEFGATGIGRMFVAHSHQAAIFKYIGVEGVKSAVAGAAIGALAGTATGVPLIGTGGGIGVGASVGWTVGSAKAAFTLEAGLAYDEYLKAGFSEDDSKQAAMIVGGVNAALEAASFTVMARMIPGYQTAQKALAGRLVSNLYARPTFAAATGQYARRYGAALTAEVTTEIVQETVTALGQEHLKAQERAEGPPRPGLERMSQEEYFDLVANITIETLKGAAFFAGAGPTVNYVNDSMRSRRATAQQAQWRALGEDIDSSDTRSKFPDTWREFLQRVQDDGPVDEVLIDREGFEAYWDSKGVDPIVAAKELGIDLDKLDPDDPDVHVPVNVFAEKIAGTEHYNGLVRDIRVREEDMSARDAAAWEEGRDDRGQEIVDSLEAREDFTGIDQRIVDDLVGELLARNAYDRGAAEKMARVMAAGVTTQALEMKVDAFELWQQRFKGLEVEGSDALKRRDFDVVLDPLIQQLKDGKTPTQQEIFGPSIVEEAVARGGLDDTTAGGELSARDAAKAVRGLVKKGGASLDAAAEWAFEQGYIAAHDENLFIDALDRELRGDPVHAPTLMNESVQQRANLLNQLWDMIQMEDIDLEALTPAEVRAKLKESREFEQGMDFEGLEELTQLVIDSTEWDQFAMDRAKSIIDQMEDEQALGEVTIDEPARIAETGETVTVKRKLQVEWDQEVSRRNVLNKLKDCLG